VEADVGLAEARATRDKYRQILRSGRNPIEVRQEERRALAKKPKVPLMDQHVAVSV
jgi:hypothetical protein